MKRPKIREIPADLETPVTAFLKLRPQGARFLLESVEQGERLGRYSFIAFGERELRLFEDRLECDGRREKVRGNPAAQIQRRTRSADGLPALFGGAVGYLGYDYVRFLERLPKRLPDPLGMPVGHFALVDDLVVFDHLARRMTLIGRDPAKLERALEEHVPRPEPGRRKPPEFRHGTSRSNYIAAVGRAQEHILAGDIIQVVLSHRVSCRITAPPFQIYRALRILNPSPYMIYFDFGPYQLVGASPEIHVKLHDGVATLRPIAGTRRRGETPDEDRALERELLADPKERAEHLMLVDLARNDLGRVCEYGSVRASELYSIERYSTVMHIVSQVDGRLRPGADLIGATFPAGTVTGAPKIRAMEIIEDLETSRRGPYGGAAGYLGARSSDLCITIRTAVVKEGTAHLQAGAGIVADSNPAAEWDETINKMASLRRAVEMAETKL